MGSSRRLDEPSNCATSRDEESKHLDVKSTAWIGLFPVPNAEIFFRRGTAWSDVQDPVPRPGYRPSGEDRAWGRRLAKRFGCEHRYDDRAFCASGTGQPEPLLDVDLGDPEPAVTELLAPVDPARGDSIIAFGWVRGDVNSV